jgi:hypothetical protein
MKIAWVYLTFSYLWATIYTASEPFGGTYSQGTALEDTDSSRSRTTFNFKEPVRPPTLTEIILYIWYSVRYATLTPHQLPADCYIS